MRTHLLVTAAAVAALSLAGCHKTGSNADKDASNPGNSAPVNTVQDAAAGPVGVVSAATPKSAPAFATAAAMGDMYEIAAGKIAVERAKRTDVKAFAQMMIDGHTKTTAELKKALADSGVTVTLPTKLDDRRNGLLENLKAAGDSDFDLAYLHQQAAAHIEALELMSNYADGGDNAVLKAAAAKTKPVVQMHLDHLKTVGGDALKDALPGGQ
jgi:putative membrane protein